MDRLISQFEVIRAIEKYVDNIFTKNMGDLINDIKVIPSVEPKIGHWINLDDKSAICSCCYKNNTLYGYFCKWCGAKMVEPQESEVKE